jgi:NTE family protein
VPGAFSVVKAKQSPSTLKEGKYTEPDRDELVREIDLSDGGMFDNLGVEPVWQDHETVLVSDAAPSFKPEPQVGWLWSALRQGVILLEQATEVRKRWLISNFLANQLKGAYWGIASRPSSYHLETEHAAYSDDLIRDYIAPIRIDLDVFSEGEIAVLENHGYLMADIALQRHAKDLGAEPWPKAEAPHEKWLDESLARTELKGSDKTHMFFRPRIHP